MPPFLTPGLFLSRWKARRFARQLLRQDIRYTQQNAHPESLSRYAESIYSQNGEDGMIAEALRRLKIVNPIFVEIGASDGEENCTRNLVEHGGQGLWIEADSDKTRRARSIVPIDRVDVYSEYVNKENVVNLISKSGHTSDGFDVLVIDTDGNDWWILQAVLAKYHPKLIVAEYNPALGPKRKWIMPYNPDHHWKHDQNYGASLTSFDRLTRKYGYRLVACDPAGVNAFWVTSEHANQFGTSHEPKTLHRYPNIADMHPLSSINSEFSTLDDNVFPNIRLNSLEIFEMKGSNLKIVAIQVENHSGKAVSSHGKSAIRVGIKTRPNEEPIRGVLLCPLQPSQRGFAFAELVMSDQILEVGIVQEGFRWSYAQNNAIEQKIKRTKAKTQESTLESQSEASQ